MTNKYEEFRNQFKVKVDSFVKQDFQLNDDGMPYYFNTNIYPDSVRIYLYSIKTGDELIEINKTDDIAVIYSFIHIFESLEFNVENTLSKIKSLHLNDRNYKFFY